MPCTFTILVVRLPSAQSCSYVARYLCKYHQLDPSPTHVSRSGVLTLMPWCSYSIVKIASHFCADSHSALFTTADFQNPRRRVLSYPSKFSTARLPGLK